MRLEQRPFGEFLLKVISQCFHFLFGAHVGFPSASYWGGALIFEYSALSATSFPNIFVYVCDIGGLD